MCNITVIVVQLVEERQRRLPLPSGGAGVDGLVVSLLLGIIIVVTNIIISIIIIIVGIIIIIIISCCLLRCFDAWRDLCIYSCLMYACALYDTCMRHGLLSRCMFLCGASMDGLIV